MLYYFKCLGGIADYKRDEVRLGKCLRPAYHVENSGSRPGSPKLSNVEPG